MNHARPVNELAPGLRAFQAVLPLLMGNPGLVVSAAISSLIVLGAAVSWFGSFFGPDTVLRGRDLLGLLGLTSLFVVWFYRRILALAWDLARYDDSNLKPLATGVDRRMLALLALGLLMATPLLATATGRLPASGLALLGIALLIVLELATFFAPHAALVEDLPVGQALRRSLGLVQPNLPVVFRYVLATNVLAGTPLLLSWMAFHQVISSKPDGSLSMGDLDLWMVLGSAFAIIGFTIALLVPPIVATTLFRSAGTREAMSSRSVGRTGRGAT